MATGIEAFAEASRPGCIFCEILAGRSEGSFVYRDDNVAAFMTLGAVNRGHVLVVPTRHATYLSDLDPEVGAEMFRFAMRAAEAIRASTLRCEGINLFLADGRAALQSVFHTHLHVFPRFRGDGFGLVMPPDFRYRRPRDELDEAAAEIRRALDATSVSPSRSIEP
ncbi:MAG: histidine triad protein [Chloroflexi bacterium]|nr:histidine triad protein [Chloroflexota bacterium]